MKRTNPQNFIGPRAYFTDFDHRIVTRANDLELLKKHTERKLKLLLLIKSKIICAASHLATDFVYNIFLDSPELLNQGIIVPALRSDKANIESLFQRKNLPHQREIINFYNSNIIETASWDLLDNSDWFKDRFIDELSNTDSLIRKQLKKLSLSPISLSLLNNMIEDIVESKVFSRSLIEHYTKSLEPKQIELLLNFRELVYHISGARIINCESALPQENYIDYDIADLTNRRTKLSEEQILFKIFLELAMDSLQKKMIPIEILDLLSFQDILKIREPLLDSDFQNSYDILIKKIINSKADNSFFDINELDNIRCQLNNVFTEIFDKELEPFIRKKQYKNLKNFGSISFSVALGVAGFIPEISATASSISVLKDTPALLTNLRQNFNNKLALDKLENYNLSKQKVLTKKINETDLTEKSSMLDMVELLCFTLSEKIKV